MNDPENGLPWQADPQHIAFAEAPHVPDGWRALASETIAAMVKAARGASCRIDVLSMGKVLYRLDIVWRGRLPPSERRIVAQAVERAMFRSQSLCETCGGRGLMHVAAGGARLRVRCDAHAEPGDVPLADQEISEMWVTHERYGKRIYDPDADAFQDVDLGPVAALEAEKNARER